MRQYHNHLEAILKYGSPKTKARDGMPETLSLFGYQTMYDLSRGFPILTTKHVNFNHIVAELLWFLRGDTNVKYLIDNKCNIWNEDAYNYYKKIEGELDYKEFLIAVIAFHEGTCTEPLLEKYNYRYGDCGKQYGWLWRNWEVKGVNDDNAGREIDQISNLIDGLIISPMGRRHIISAWNPATINEMALPACHAFVQFNCRYTNNKAGLHTSHAETLNEPEYYLDCQLYQRSADMFLGVPYNIASYALLTHIIAKICNMVPGHFIHTFGDSHIYGDHREQVNLLLSRDPNKYRKPNLVIRDEGNDWTYIRSTHDFSALDCSDFYLDDYQSYPEIKAKLSTGLK